MQWVKIVYKRKIKRGKKLKQRFPMAIFGPVNILLHKGFYTAAVILLCCGIDYLSKFYSGTLEYSNNKKRYIDFLKKYFPRNKSPEDFYTLIRSGLIHSYYLEENYIFEKDPLGPHFEETTLKGKNVLVINPWRLKGDVKKALISYLYDIEKNEIMYLNYLKVYEKIKLKNPTLKVKRKKIYPVAKESN